ncbi:hypothetical protein AK830_g831 [Neonectria ditissima]|uniref:Uncharacterized protein n=1 Tax=Neonectria ditissima TaxID=78410 RepID=A0A0P7BGD0_9HYPO|nr:hypothetical protein AK830_g831 [Neonectria ditissima]
MSFFFQPPIFLLQPSVVPLAVATPVTFTPAPILTTPIVHSHIFTYPMLTLQIHPPPLHVVPPIRFKVIFHGTRRPGRAAGVFHASTDAVYATAPSRAGLLANLSFWAAQHGLGDRVYSGQARMYLTRDAAAPVVMVGAAPLAEDVVRTVELSERLPPGELEALVEGVRAGRHGAVLVVDVDAREGIERRLRGGEGDDGGVVDGDVVGDGVDGDGVGINQQPDLNTVPPAIQDPNDAEPEDQAPPSASL